MKLKKNFCTKALRFALDINIHCIVKKYFRILFQKKKQNFKLENAETLSGKIFGLPNHYRLKKKELDYIIKALGVSLSDKVKIIAEAGINHNGNYKKVFDLVDIAKNSNADFVKFQLFNTDYFINKKFKHKNINFEKIYNRFKKIRIYISAVEKGL